MMKICLFFKIMHCAQKSDVKRQICDITDNLKANPDSVISRQKWSLLTLNVCACVHILTCFRIFMSSKKTEALSEIPCGFIKNH